MTMNEIDLGAVCLECNDKCPGFEAHSWRYFFSFLFYSFLFDLSLGFRR
jgi:hypothetical protein